MTETEPMLRDLKRTIAIILNRLDNMVKSEDIKELATKQDLKIMDDRICTQGQEISQL